MDEIPESAKNYRDHASTEAFFHRLGEGCGLGLVSLMALLGFVFLLQTLGTDAWIFGVLLLSYFGFVALGGPLRSAIFTPMPDLRSSEEALWVKFGWRWRRLDMRTVQASETPDGLRICSPQLPRYCVGYRQDQTDDHRRWKGFGVSNKIPAYDSLLYNLEAGGARIAPW